MKCKTLWSILLLTALIQTHATAQNTCANAIQINTFPYNGLQTATLGTGDDYNANGCGSSLYIGEDFVYELNVTGAPVTYQFDFFTSNNIGQMGAFFYDACPTNGGNCIAPPLTITTSGTSTSCVNFPVNGTYYVIVDNQTATAGNFSMNITVAQIPICPVLFSPANNYIGPSPTFTWSTPAVNVNNYNAVYDVYLGTSVGNATVIGSTSTSSFTPSAPLPVGSYVWYILPRNLNGTRATCATSFNTFTIVNPPANDDCVNAITVTQNPHRVWITGNTAAATPSGVSACNANVPDDDVWYKFVATDTVVAIDFGNTPALTSGALIAFEMLSGSCGSLSSIYCDEYINNKYYRVGSLTPGNTYYFRIYTKASGTYSNFEFSLVDMTFDHCATAPVLPMNYDGIPDTTVFGSAWYTTFSGLPFPLAGGCIGGVPKEDSWYQFTATQSTHVLSVDVHMFFCGLCFNYPIRGQLYSGNCGALSPIGACDIYMDNYSSIASNNTGGLNSTLLTNLTPGTTYYVRLFTANASHTRKSFEIGISVPPPPPANDECSGAINIISGVNEAACSGTSVVTTSATQSMTTSCASNANNDDVWYAFTATAQGVVFKFDNLTSTFNNAGNIGMNLYTGNCGSLTAVPGACAANFTNKRRYVGGLTPGQTYYLQVFTSGTNDQAEFNLCLYDSLLTAPVTCANLTAPANNATGISNMPTLTWVHVHGASSYDVYMGTSVATATVIGTTSANSFNVSGLSSGTQYYWYIVPKNGNGSVTGCSNAAFNFTTIPPPPNNNANNAIAITVGNTCTGFPFSNVNADHATGEPYASCIKNSGNSSVWHKFTAPASGFVRIKVNADNSLGGLEDMSYAVYSATDASNYSTFSNIGCGYTNGGSGAYEGYMYMSSLTPGSTYYIEIDGYVQTAQGDYCVEVEEVNQQMLAGDMNCVTTQTLSVKESYNGWYNLLSGDRLIALIRNNVSGSGSVVYAGVQNVNTSGVREYNGHYYLDRSYHFDAFGNTGGSYDVRVFFTDADMNALKAKDAAVTDAGSLNVTKVEGLCNTVYGGVGIKTFLPQTANQSGNGVHQIEFQTASFSNFYLHSGQHVLSVPNISDHAEVQVYPNPVKNNLHIVVEGTVAKGDAVTLYDITGKEVIRKTMQGNKAVINVGNLPDGMYILQYRGSKVRETLKITKQ